MVGPLSPVLISTLVWHNGYCPPLLSPKTNRDKLDVIVQYRLDHLSTGPPPPLLVTTEDLNSGRLDPSMTVESHTWTLVSPETTGREKDGVARDGVRPKGW